MKDFLSASCIRFNEKNSLLCATKTPLKIFCSKIKMQPVQRAYFELHIAVFLFGFTAILGDLISLPALSLVWWRVALTCLSLLFFIRLNEIFRKIPRKHFWHFTGIGLIVALHWIAFYGSIKLANASIALICLATISFFTSLIEPAVMGYKVRAYELALGLLIIPGMWLIAGATEVGMQAGLWAGILSAFLASIFAVLNKKLIEKADSFSITFIELGSAWLFLSLLLPFVFFFQPDWKFVPQGLDWLYLLVLALLCTTLAYVLSLRALRHLSAFISNLTINLEPVYGILMAVFILKDNEELTPDFYLGGAIILLAVFSYPFLKKWSLRREKKV